MQSRRCVDSTSCVLDMEFDDMVHRRVSAADQHCFRDNAFDPGPIDLIVGHPLRRWLITPS